MNIRMAKLIHTVITIGAHWSCRFRMIQAELRLAYHWSPLELEIEDIGMAGLIQTVITIGAHWSPLELEIENIGMAELIQTVLTLGAHWSCISRMTHVELGLAYHWRSLEVVRA